MRILKHKNVFDQVDILKKNSIASYERNTKRKEETQVLGTIIR